MWFRITWMLVAENGSLYIYVGYSSTISDLPFQAAKTDDHHYFDWENLRL